MLLEIGAAVNETAFELPGIITALVTAAKGLTGFSGQPERLSSTICTASFPWH